VYTLATPGETKKQTMIKAYGQRVTYTFLAAKDIQGPTLVFAYKTDVAILKQLFSRHALDLKIKVVSTDMCKQVSKYSSEKFVRVIYNSVTQKPDEYLQILAGMLGDEVVNITNIFESKRGGKPPAP
jgi:hypothetical protein